MKKKPFAMIIILHWKGLHFLKDNLSSVLNQLYENYEVLIADNGSEDGTEGYVQKLMKKHKRLKYLRLDKNYGYAQGYNKAFDHVLGKDKAEFIVCLNDDVRVDENWLANLLEGFTSDDIGITTSKILLYRPYQQIVIIPQDDAVLKGIKIDDLDYHNLIYHNGFEEKGGLLELPMEMSKGEIYSLAVPYRELNQKRGKLKVELNNSEVKAFIGEQRYILQKNSNKKILLDGDYVIQNAGSHFVNRYKYFEDREIFNFDKELPSQIVDAGCGASMAIRAELIEKLGGFKDEYEMYFEDSELSYRYSTKGFKTRFVPNSICYHVFWGSSGAKTTYRQAFYGTRNRLLFIREYFGILTFLYFYFRTLVRTYIWMVKYLLTRSKEYKMFLTAYSDVLVDIIRKLFKNGKK